MAQDNVKRTGMIGLGAMGVQMGKHMHEGAVVLTGATTAGLAAMVRDERAARALLTMRRVI